VSGVNEEQREYWNTEESSHWVDQQERYDEMLAPFGAAMLDAADLGSDSRVLDIGCGNGATTRDAARAAPEGAALGIDLSAPMIEQARRIAAKEALTNVTFEVADAQTRDFEPEFDRALSRFGVMFFEDTAAAFANIRSALAAGGRVSFAVWQEIGANEWLMVPASGLLQHVTMPDLGAPGPGPFALADADEVRDFLTAAGYSEIAIDSFRASILVGGRGTLDDAMRFLTNTGVARRLLGDAEPAARERAVAAARDAVEPFMTPDGLRLDGAAWLVRAAA
jgi:SAM-dependent methyltransferase